MVLGVWHWAYGLALAVWILGVWFWVDGFGHMVLGIWFWEHGFGCMAITLGGIDYLIFKSEVYGSIR